MKGYKVIKLGLLVVGQLRLRSILLKYYKAIDLGLPLIQQLRHPSKELK